MFAFLVPSTLPTAASKIVAPVCRSAPHMAHQPSATSPTPVSRRAALLSLALLLPALHGAALANAAPVSGRSVVNGVLSAYGLPNMPDTKGFTPVLEQFGNLVVRFSHPSSWITVKAKMSEGGSISRGRRPLINVGDFRKAEGATLFVADFPGALTAQAVAQIVVPGDSTGSDPEFTVISWVPMPGGFGINQLECKYTTTTTSGYQIERRMLACATVVDKQMVAIAVSASSARWKEMRVPFLTLCESFQVYRV